MNAARTKKRGRGRPKSANPAAARIAFRVTDDQRARYQDAAEREGLSLTVWIERQLDRSAPAR